MVLLRMQSLTVEIRRQRVKVCQLTLLFLTVPMEFDQMPAAVNLSIGDAEPDN